MTILTRPYRRWILAGLGLAVACAPATVPPVTRPPAPEAAPARPAPEEVPRPVPPGPAPAAEAPVPAGPPRIRVGLATDLSSFMLPCCDPRLTVRAGREELRLDVVTRVDPADDLARRAVYHLQVAALKDEDQASGVADYLRRATDEPADAVFDAGTDLYKVRWGRFTTRAEAEAERPRLAALGLAESWVVSDGEALENPGFKLTRGGKDQVVPGRWLEVAAADGTEVRFPNRSYRGKILLYLNDRGHLNVVNELDLEDYLRGVVPEEMGPELYNQLEALKAQAVAARTFAVHNLGEFAAEGYDLCSTPRCQVYGGMSVEHPISDRAIAETAGEVMLFGGEPADAVYGSTCGGHTENVEVIFPAKNGSYLRGVPCLEAGSTPLVGGERSGTPFPDGLMARLLPPSLGKRTRVLAARLEHLALLADLPVPQDRLRAMTGKEIVRFSASVFDLALDRRLVSSASELEQWMADPPSDWRPRDHRLGAFLLASGLLAEAERDLRDSEVESFLFHLALYLGVLRQERVHFLALSDDQLRVRRGEEHATCPLPGKLGTYRRDESDLRAGPLELLAGDRMELYWHRDRLLAVVQLTSGPPVALHRHAPHRRWTRFKTDQQLRRSVQARYPGFPFEDFEVLERGVSGRVGRLRLLGHDGRTQVVEGLAVRWTLDVPDTLFTARRHQPADGRTGWLFEGRGWGHGVGLCQTGAFGMATRGLDYREILEHYYSGIDLGPIPAATGKQVVHRTGSP